jgi:hypothetical protein
VHLLATPIEINPLRDRAFTKSHVKSMKESKIFSITIPFYMPTLVIAGKVYNSVL